MWDHFVSFWVGPDQQDRATVMGRNSEKKYHRRHIGFSSCGIHGTIRDQSENCLRQAVRSNWVTPWSLSTVSSLEVNSIVSPTCQSGTHPTCCDSLPSGATEHSSVHFKCPCPAVRSNHILFFSCTDVCGSQVFLGLSKLRGILELFQSENVRHAL